MSFEFCPGVLPSVGELFAADLSALGRGVSKIAFRLAVPFILAIRGVEGETPSSPL